MSKLKTPHQKKKASLARDRRSVAGQNDEAARKKARLNRAARHEVHVKLRVDGAPVEKVDPDVLEAAVAGTRRKEFKKTPDVPLVEYIEQQRERRALPPLRARGAKKRR